MTGDRSQSLARRVEASLRARGLEARHAVAVLIRRSEGEPWDLFGVYGYGDVNRVVRTRKALGLDVDTRRADTLIGNTPPADIS